MQLSKMLAVDLAPDGIRVNCYCPGSIHTQIVDKFLPEGKIISVNGDHALCALADLLSRSVAGRLV